MKRINRLFRVLMSLFMVLALIPRAAGVTVARAADDDTSGGETSIDGLVASKYININDDGSYTISLDSYATGTVKTDTKVVPCDIILVLDTSSSMVNNYMDSLDDFTRVTSDETINNSTSEFYYKSSDDNYHAITITRHQQGSGRNRTYSYEVTVEGFDGSQSTSYSSNSSTSLSSLIGFVRTITGDESVNVTDLYKAESTQVTRLQALQTAVKSFLLQVASANSAVENAADHSRVSIVSYNDKSYVQTGSKKEDADSFVDVSYSDASKTGTNLDSIVDSDMDQDSHTRTDTAMTSAVTILNDLGTSTTRKHLVILFTDGYPATSQNEFNTTYATDAVKQANICKTTHGATVYSVAVLEDALPEQNPETYSYSSDNAKHVNQMLHAISSNYPTANATTGLNITWGDNKNYQGGYYLAAKTADDLKNIFDKISESTGQATIELGSESVMMDIVSKSFTLPPNVTASDIHIRVVEWDTNTHNWKNESLTTEEWKAKYPSEDIHADINGSTVDITGFDYSLHCKSDATEEQDAQVNTKAAKIVVDFVVYASPASITGSTVETNGSASGIYDKDGNMILQFKVPSVKFQSKTYVIDYAKPIDLDYHDLLETVEMIDDPSDSILKGLLTVSNDEMAQIIAAFLEEHPEYKDADGKLTPEGAAELGKTYFNFEVPYQASYGAVKFEEVHAQDGWTESFDLKYYPTTMNWNGYDNLFIKGLNIASKKNAWIKLSVIPANNVYYEDTFGQALQFEGSDESTSSGTNTVTIEVNGIDYSGAVTESEEGSNNESSNTGISGGWDNVDLADDNGDSDGTVTEMLYDKNNTAKASFTFTGTGVDVYSRTTPGTGVVLATLTDKDGNEVEKKKIDTKSQSGEYYNVPTLSFNGLTHGEYKLSIEVSYTLNSRIKKRFTYYLDGVRVYNPIQNCESDDTVKEAYTNELNAVFVAARELMSDDDVAFVDENVVDGKPSGTATGKYTDSELGKYAPLNEIYLQAGQSVILSADQADHYYLGMRSLDGKGTKVTITVPGNKTSTVAINNTVDLYGEVGTNSDGKIVVSVDNDAAGLLAITKLRCTSDTAPAAAGNSTSAISSEEALRIYQAFKAMPNVEYNSALFAEEELEEETVTENVAEPEEETQVEVVVENPEPVEETEEETSTSSYSWLDWLFGGFRSFFRP